MLRTARLILSELRLRPKTWPDLLTLFQSALNQSLSAHLGDVATITAFTGLALTPPISTFMHSQTSRPVTLETALLTRVVEIQKLEQRMTELHLL